MVMSYNAGPELGIIEVHTTNEGGTIYAKCYKI
jgi:hypothetical protein